MTTHDLRSTLESGKAVLGTWSIIPCPAVHEILGLGGMDFQILDMEHGPYGLPEIEAGIRACEAVSCAPLVRVPMLDTAMIQSVLDSGAQGIVVPHVRNADDVHTAIAATKYPPDGTRGFNPFTRNTGYDPRGTQRVNRPFSCVIVEDRDACEKLEEILAVPGLDAVYMGAYDLSVSMGHPGTIEHPDVAALIDRCVRQIRAAGKAAGMMVRTDAAMQQALALGATMLAWSVDTDLLRTAVADSVEAFRKYR